jgi:hypothetical protein
MRAIFWFTCSIFSGSPALKGQELANGGAFLRHWLIPGPSSVPSKEQPVTQPPDSQENKRLIYIFSIDIRPLLQFQ